MKKLLLSSILFIGSFSLFAQGDCSSAIDISNDISQIAPAVTGTYTLACDQTNGELTSGVPAGIWYKFTPTTDGTLKISSAGNAAPNSDDTRLSIFTGTCSNLTCVGGNDDISAADYLSTYQFNATSGITYYIQWDNRFSGLGFNFTIDFTSGFTCLPVTTVNAVTNIATTSVTLNWAAAAGNPAEYEIEYVDLGFPQNTGTVVTVSTNSANLTGLSASGVYDYYIRSKCSSSSFSDWTAVNSFTTAKVLPYASGLDNTASLLGWTIAGAANQGLGNNAAAAQSPSGYWIFGTATAPGPNNNWLFTPAVSLQAGEKVTISFYHRATTDARTLRVTVGDAATIVAQSNQILATAIPAGTVWAQITVPEFTASTAGIYYFGFNDNSTATPTAVSNMRLDTFSFTSVLGTNDFLSSKFSIYPNPVSNVINFSNDQNAIVSSVEMADLNGRVIKSLKVNATEGQISVSDLATGMYMMKITTDQGVAVKKIIKQ